jgi:5-methylcytosine-specific restriction enzyme B
VAFAVWYYRNVDLGPGSITREKLRSLISKDLSLSPSEMELIFVPDIDWSPSTQEHSLKDEEIFDIVKEVSTNPQGTKQVIHQTFEQHSVKVRSMITLSTGPEWLNVDPQERLKSLVDAGVKSILLYGPPRTSKTYAIDSLFPRTSPERETIQIHNVGI